MTDPTKPKNNRRSAIAAIVAGALAVLTPLGVGIASFLTPLFKTKKSPKVRVALLSQVPDDGMPRSFPVVADRQDAWTGYEAQRIGAVYLVRNPGEAEPIAFTAKCPHAGCLVGYTPGDTVFKCPCHTSSFNLDGTRVRGDEEVSPRGMDTLPVELKKLSGDGDIEITEIHVEYIDYQTGHAEKHSTA
ncbi:QcrA and Rieske domain-containing protein [Adhaeretor mobilis]|uniref:Cytochrome b6-f complex iron-sulfur subunit n=1 Tax=Adhaeretor mobilis TaxID=1930276 RepID=A0A517N070_9BACT|nr:Rieske 2Fe-2S domain-containing protein [Adhaeretor mobilis]QDT00526.1 Cytochrome b6-f complex iron-sulfur subunit [Adhaeretor mobilis]